LSGRAATPPGSESAIAEEARAHAEQTEILVTRATSNVAYLVSQMRRHKRGVLLALGLVAIAAIAVSYLLFFKRGSMPAANQREIVCRERRTASVDGNLPTQLARHPGAAKRVGTSHC